jgi:aryl-alcohol dehydrogenase-like predicted oxidoreductase
VEIEMEKVLLGKIGLEASALIMGSDVLGSKLDRETSFALLDCYFENGGNLIDTANFYASWLARFSGGESESVIGMWMRERGTRDQVLVSSKLAFDYPGCDGGLSAAEIARECEKSLKRLQTDRLDIYYAHRDDLATPLEETMAAFDALVVAGKIRLLGASNLPVWRIADANAIARKSGHATYEVIQQRYTYLRPRHGADFGPQIFLNGDTKAFAKQHGIGLIAYSVLLQGSYTRLERPLPPQFGGGDSDERLAVLKSVADEFALSPNQIVIAWMRQSNPFILPIIAASKTEQLRENIDALTVKLTADQMSRLNSAGNPVIRDAWLQST